MTREDFVKAIDDRYSSLLVWTIKDFQSYGEDIGLGLAEDVKRYRCEIFDGVENRTPKAIESTREAWAMRVMIDGLESAVTLYATVVEQLEGFIREGEGATAKRQAELLKQADAVVADAYRIWSSWRDGADEEN